MVAADPTSGRSATLTSPDTLSGTSSSPVTVSGLPGAGGLPAAISLVATAGISRGTSAGANATNPVITEDGTRNDTPVVPTLLT
jgi:hypothetical protein